MLRDEAAEDAADALAEDDAGYDALDDDEINELRAAQMAVAAEEGDTDGLAALVEEDQTMLHAVRLGSAIEIGTPRLSLSLFQRGVESGCVLLCPMVNICLKWPVVVGK